MLTNSAHERAMVQRWLYACSQSEAVTAVELSAVVVVSSFFLAADFVCEQFEQWANHIISCEEWRAPKQKLFSWSEKEDEIIRVV